MCITCLYKNGMNDSGFTKNSIGTGVSVSEKKDIYDGVLSLRNLSKKEEGSY